MLPQICKTMGKMTYGKNTATLPVEEKYELHVAATLPAPFPLFCVVLEHLYGFFKMGRHPTGK